MIEEVFAIELCEEQLERLTFVADGGGLLDRKEGSLGDRSPRSAGIVDRRRGE